MRFSYDELDEADLIVGADYEQGHCGKLKGEPIHQLVGVGNSGGFRTLGAWTVPGATLVVLFSTGDVSEWPDAGDRATGRFVYYGDNRDPDSSAQRALEGRKGNKLLRTTFDALHRGDRSSIPPFLAFEQVQPGNRSVRFLGLLAPGAPGLGEDEDLVAYWHSVDPSGPRFLNYRSTFTVLDEERLPRPWLNQIRTEAKWIDGCPDAWQRFVDTGDYPTLLRAP